jgi:hypothetical protein
MKPETILEVMKLSATVVGAILLAMLILKLIEPKKAGEWPLMVGALLVCGSVILGVYVFWFYDVTVLTKAGLLVHQGRSDERMIFLGCSGLGILVGVILAAVGMMRRPVKTD